jgi:hypothetical protein
MRSVQRIPEAILKPPYLRARAAAIRTVQRRSGISTAGVISPEDLGFSSEYSMRYQPSHWFALRRILRRNEVDSGDVFVDFGAGMGQVVYQAAMSYRFGRVEGVELSSELTKIAENNIHRNRHRLRCQDVRLVSCDALEYEIPDDLTVAYFFNPFQGPIFASVIDRLRDSVDRHPRRLRIIYLNPVEEQMLLDAGFRITRRLHGMRPGHVWSRSNSTRMYELPPGPA